MQVITNALWYLTNQHTTINDAADSRPDVLAVPEWILKYSGYNEVKHKKVKSIQMCETDLERHGLALFSLLQKPIINSSPKWKDAGKDITAVAECIMAYKAYLEKQLAKQKANQQEIHPVRTIHKCATIEQRKKLLVPHHLKEDYALLDTKIKALEIGQPLFFDEAEHLVNPFVNRMQRFRFIKNLQLTVPIDIIRYSPGGSEMTTLCLVHAKENRSEPDTMIEGAHVMQRIAPKLKEFHTRTMKAEFKQKLSNIAKISPAVHAESLFMK